MKKRFFKALIFTFLTVFISCGVCFADLLSVLPKATIETNSFSKITVRFTDTSKLIEDLYSPKYFEVMGSLPSNLGFDIFIRIGHVAKALSNSNLREFASFIVIDDVNSTIHSGGMIFSVPGGEKVLKEAVESGKLTFFSLILSLGEPTFEAMKSVDASFEDFEFECDSDGVFFYSNNYVYIVGDKIAVFDTKETTLSVGQALKSETKTIMTNLESPNVILLHISKNISKTPDDIEATIDFSYENSTWKIKTKSNFFKLVSNFRDLEGAALEEAQKVVDTIPMIGKGAPFFVSGGNTFFDGLDSIEDYLMNTGDMILTLNWATFLQLAHQYGISKTDIGNLFAGSVAMIFGLDTRLFELSLPLGGYIAFTGKNEAAKTIINAISVALSERFTVDESEVVEWNKVYSVAFDPFLPNVLIAQKGETLLVGFMNSEDLKHKLNAQDVTVTDEKIIGWSILNIERIWKSVRKAYVPVSAMILSGMFGKISDSEKEAMRFVQLLIMTDFPVNALNIWIPSADELDIRIIMNPSQEGNFWKVFFEWLAKMVDK